MAMTADRNIRNIFGVPPCQSQQNAADSLTAPTWLQILEDQARKAQETCNRTVSIAGCEGCAMSRTG